MIRYLESVFCASMLACVAAAQCWSPGQVIYHPPATYHPAPVLIHSRVIEPVPAPVQVEQAPAAAAPAAKPLVAPEGCSDGCKIEYTDEDHEGPQVMNFGVQLGKVGQQPKYRLNGKEISREQAIAAVAGDQIPDDVGLVRLTLIGSKEDRQRVLADLDSHPGLKALKASLLVQAYDADDPRVSKRGFVCNGKPSIYLSAPDGKVLARNLDGEYAGAHALAYAIGEAGGKPYSPDADKPMPVKPEPPAPLAIPKSLAEVPAWAWVAGAVALFLFFRKGGAQ